MRKQQGGGGGVYRGQGYSFTSPKNWKNLYGVPPSTDSEISESQINFKKNQINFKKLIVFVIKILTVPTVGQGGQGGQVAPLNYAPKYYLLHLFYLFD